MTVAEENKDDMKDPMLLTLEDIREHCRLLERSVVSKENRFIVRVLRSLPATRKKLSNDVLKKIVRGYFTHSNEARDSLAKYLYRDGETDMDDGQPGIRFRSNKLASTSLLPEIDCYLHLLVFLRLMDEKKLVEAEACSEELMAKLSTHNRRSMDHIAARSYYHYAQCHEAKGQLSTIRGFLHGKLRIATLNKDSEGQAVLINCLLRNYIHNKLYDLAQKLVEKATFPDSASNSEQARYLYYYGRIKAIQLEYTAALDFFTKALRKAPSSAHGFRQLAQKLKITVDLLLGNIPDRKLFLQANSKEALAPYFELTRSVRSGEIDNFLVIKRKYENLFKEDGTFTLILRVHQNVIKTAIRKISLAYSRISLTDVAKKLRLGTPDKPDHLAAEYIIAKAIKDGVIEATLDHQNSWMQSKEIPDIYSTREPQLQFHDRIQFCLDMHNQSVKAMRYPPKSYNNDLETAEERKEREAQDLELAKEMTEDDMI